MKIVKMSFSEDEFQRLSEKAAAEGLSVQDCIRAVLFTKTETIFTPEEAERRALTSKNTGDVFSWTDLYTEEERAQISRGEAGVFGKRFSVYVEQKSEVIEFYSTINNRALYRMKG